MSATNLHQSIIEDCLAYFNQEGIPAHEDDGSVYITVTQEDEFERTVFEIQISKAEVLYRADLFREQEAEAHAANVWGPNPSV